MASNVFGIENRQDNPLLQSSLPDDASWHSAADSHASGNIHGYAFNAIGHPSLPHDLRFHHGPIPDSYQYHLQPAGYPFINIYGDAGGNAIESFNDSGHPSLPNIVFSKIASAIPSDVQFQDGPFSDIDIGPVLAQHQLQPGGVTYDEAGEQLQMPPYNQPGSNNTPARELVVHPRNGATR